MSCSVCSNEQVCLSSCIHVLIIFLTKAVSMWKIMDQSHDKHAFTVNE